MIQMASEVTYAEVKFDKRSPPAVSKASSKTGTPLGVFQRIPPWFPWVMAGFFMLLSIALLVVIFVTLRGYPKKTSLKNLPENSTDLSCLLRRPGGAEQKLSCCKEGWQRFQSSCYSFSKDKMTWNKSMKKCADLDSNLVVINSKAEQEFLINQTKVSNGEKNFCIGLRDSENNEKWQWVDQTPINSTELFWRRDEPSNKEERCVVMHRRRENDIKNWNDVICEQNDHYYICESMVLIL